MMKSKTFMIIFVLLFLILKLGFSSDQSAQKPISAVPIIEDWYRYFRVDSSGVFRGTNMLSKIIPLKNGEIFYGHNAILQDFMVDSSGLIRCSSIYDHYSCAKEKPEVGAEVIHSFYLGDLDTRSAKKSSSEKWDIAVELTDNYANLDLFLLSALNPAKCIAANISDAIEKKLELENLKSGIYYIVVDSRSQKVGSYSLKVSGKPAKGN